MIGARIKDIEPSQSGCTVTLDIGGSAFDADFSYKAGEPLDRGSQELAGILAANFALSYLPLDDIEFICSDDEEFRLMSTLAYQSRMSYAYFARANKQVSEHLLNTEPSYTWKKVAMDRVHVVQDPDSVLCFYSGGKDSTLSLKVFENAGYRVLPLVTSLTKDEYRYTSDDAPKSLNAAGRDFAEAYTNIDEIKPLFSEITGYPLLEGTIRLYWVANALPLATRLNARYISLSAELTLTHVVEYADRRIFNNLFDQVFPAGVLINRLLEKKGFPCVLSIIQGLTVYGIQKILKTHFPQEIAHQLTCNHPVWDEKRGQWRCCSQCEVCRSLYVIVKALGMPPDVVRLDEDKLLKGRSEPGEMVGPAISQKEIEHCLALNNTYAPDYRGIRHPEVNGIQFSAAYHNPALVLTHGEYLRLYGTLNNLLQGGIYLCDDNSCRESNLEEVWHILSNYDYTFDGRDPRLVKNGLRRSPASPLVVRSQKERP